MAIKGIILKNSYAVVDNLNINKRDKSFSFDFIIYKDESKKDILLRSNYYITANNKCMLPSITYSSFKEYEEKIISLLKEVKDLPFQEISNNKDYNKIIINGQEDHSKDGIYIVNSNVHNEVNLDNEIEIKNNFSYTKDTTYEYYYLNQSYYILIDNQFVLNNGLNTDHFFETKVLKQVGDNYSSISIAYTILKLIDDIYNTYENV